MRIGCVVMAAGMGSRFGGNKLARQWQGKSLIRHALEAVPATKLSATVVVTQYSEVVTLAKEFNFTPIVNSHPEYGQSHTIHLGVQALGDCDALLFQVADQPLLRPHRGPWPRRPAGQSLHLPCPVLSGASEGRGRPGRQCGHPPA